MLSQLKQWATFNHFEREEYRRMARIQLSMIVFFLGLGLLALIINLFSWQNHFLTGIITMGAVLHFIPLGLLAKNKLTFGSFFLTSLYVLISVDIATIGGGLHAYVLMLFPIIIMFAGITAQQRGLIFATVLTLAAIAWLFFGEVLGWVVITTSHIPDWSDLVIVTILVLALAWMVYWLVTKYQFGLAQTWQELDKRKRLETELRKLTQAIEQSPVSIIITNLDGVIEYVNPRFTEITGYRPEEAIGKNPSLLKSNQTLPKVYQQLWENLKAGREWHGEFVNQRKDGTQYHESAAILPITDANGIVTHYLSVQEDITERMQAQQALSESESRYRRLVNGLPVILYTFSNQRGGLFQSPYVEQELGYSNEYLQANPFLWNNSIHPEDKPKVANAIANSKAGQSFDVEYRIRTKSGEWRWLMDRSIGRTIENDELLVEGVVTDITERKLAEQALQEKTQELEGFFITTLDLLCIADSECIFRRLNREWENTLGYSLSELEGKRFIDFVHPDDLESTLKTLSRLNHQENILNLENRYRCKDGSYRWIEWRSIPFGKTIYAAARDITERKQIEQTLRESHARQQALFEHARDAILIADPKTGLILDANSQAEKLFGVLRQAIIGKHQSDLHPAQTKAQSLNNFQEHSSGMDKLFDDEIVAADGRIIPVEINASLVSLPNGNQVLQGIFRDITGRKRNQAMLQARLEILELAAHQSLDEFMQSALDKIAAMVESEIGFYHFVSEDQKTLSLQAWSTRTLQEFCKTEGKGLHYDVDKAGVWADCIREGKPVVHNNYESMSEKKGLPPGHARVVRELVVPIYRNGRVVSILGVGNKPTNYLVEDIQVVSYLADVIWEIVQRKQIERSLTEVESRLHLLSQNLNDAGLYVYTHDAEGKSHFEYLSPGMEALTGVKHQDALRSASSIHAVILPEYLPNLVDVEALSKQNLQPFEIEFRQRHAISGEIRWMLVRSTPRSRTDGSTVWYGVQIDVTERKANEQLLKKANELLRTQMSEIEKLQEDLREQALHDSLTELYNRRYLEESLKLEINRARRTSQPFCVVILDLDDLKAINDRHGHITGGDRALQTLASALKRMCRDSDTICRYGGDEFLALMYDTPSSAALRRANEWLEEVRKLKFKSEVGEFNITFSAGLAEYKAGDVDGEGILIRADRALYRAKESGKNRVECYTDGMDS